MNISLAYWGGVGEGKWGGYCVEIHPAGLGAAMTPARVLSHD